MTERPVSGAPGRPRAGEVLARLEREIGQGELSADASQRMVAQRLDRLRSALLQAHTPAKRLRNGFRRLLGRPLQSAPAGLYLWGGVGRGKTLLMDHFVASLDGLVPLQRTHFYRFMHSVHAQLKLLAGRPDPLAAVTAAMSESVQVLCLDEFLVADIGDAMILSGLLTGLLRAGITLVTTSNLAPAELYRGGLQRERFLPAIELLEQRLEVVELQGDIDYRLRLLEAAPGLFRIEGPDTPAEFESLLHLLGGNPSPAPGTIEIEGRSIAVRGLGPSVAWFEFDALCEGPRSQNDYIDIARRFSTLILTGVPVLDATRDDAARRFLMLIDELYDRGVKLVLSARAAPEALYRGERLAAEFARTVSRLIEMQSASYLAGSHRP